MTAVEKVAPAIPLPTRVGQATAVEQSRAAAEVAAAAALAKSYPRDVQAALAEMRTTTKQKSLAERAFFRFPRAGTAVSGASVHLARELARCWRNIQYGIVELSRDDDAGESEMQAYAWDVENNTKVENKFIVKHLRDKRGGPERLTDVRDIYENNANNGARRLREAIFAVLPPWFTEEAKDRCMETLADGGGKPLAQRVADCISTYGGIGVTQGQLEEKVGRPAAEWLELDVAQLGVTFTSIKRGEVSRAEEFPPARVTAAELAGQKPKPADDKDWQDAPQPRAAA